MFAAIAPEKSNEKLATIKPFKHEGGFSDTEEGKYLMTLTPTQAGMSVLHLWCCAGEKGERVPLPGSPFQLLVQAGAADAAASEVDGYSIEAHHIELASSKKHQSRGNLIQPPQPDVNQGKIVAGDTVLIRPSLRDTYGNPATVPDQSLTVVLEGPDGSNTEMDFQEHLRGGLATYEVKHNTEASGRHLMHIRLYGIDIKGSPVEYHIAPGAHESSLTLLSRTHSLRSFTPMRTRLTLSS